MQEVKAVPLTEAQKSEMGKPYDVGEWFIITINGQPTRGGPYNQSEANSKVEKLRQATPQKNSKHKKNSSLDDGPP